jgi:hypothetical protein
VDTSCLGKLQSSDLRGRLREGKAMLDDRVDRFHPHSGLERVGKLLGLANSGRANVRDCG